MGGAAALGPPSRSIAPHEPLARRGRRRRSGRLALVELARDGARREWSFGEVADRSARLAGHARGDGIGPRRRRDDADRQPAGVGRSRWSRACGSAPSRCRAPSSCAPRTCGCASRSRGRSSSSPTSATASSSPAAQPACPVLYVPDDALYDGRARAARGPRRRGPVPAHVHQRHGGRAEVRRPRRALPRRPARAGRALARRAARRPRLVHGVERLVEVGAQRLHRAVAPRRLRAAARRALRPRRTPRAPRARARERALHGADRVPRDRQARAAARLRRRCAAWSPPARR